MSESPLQLFKFMHVSGEISDDLARLEQLLKEPYLWSADPTEFNDPFEFKVSVDWSASDVELRRRFSTDMPNESDAAFLDWKNSLTPEFRRNVAMSTRRDLLSKLGVWCSSQEVYNQLLWAHYGPNHTGYAAEFALEDPLTLPHSIASGNIAYRDQKEKWNLGEDEDKFWRKTCFVKSKPWAYEKEFRILFSKRGKILIPPNSLRAIYLGCRAPMELRARAREVGSIRSLKVFQMCESPFEFKLDAVEVKQNAGIMSSFF
jgi:hypothetical protein